MIMNACPIWRPVLRSDAANIGFSTTVETDQDVPRNGKHRRADSCSRR